MADDQQTTIPAGLRTDPPPENPTRQIVAWAIDLHGGGYRKPAEDPRWMILQWGSEYTAEKAYWRWSVPGRSTEAHVLGWLPLPALDKYGQWSAERMEAANAE